jgi:hypothetical protein
MMARTISREVLLAAVMNGVAALGPGYRFSFPPIDQ